jgi:splicing factor 3A subunit 1
MSSLSLPAPKHVEDDSLATTPSVTNGSATPAEDAAEDFLAGIILPPPDIRSIVDKTATFIAKNKQPEIFEEKMRAREKTDSRFAFMNKTDAYHAYYQHSLAEERRKVKGGDVSQEKQVEESAAAEAMDTEQEPEEPPALEFLIETPPAINAVDL